MFYFIFLSVCAALFSGSVQAEFLPPEIDVKSDSLFVPTGYDDNDEVVIVLDGYLPNPCYRLVRPYVSVNPLNKEVVVEARAREYAGFCPTMPVPFTEEVRVGRMRGGHHHVVTRDRRLRATLPVSRSTSKEADDYLYAPVDSARIAYPGGLRWVAVLEGRFTNTCLSIEETKVSLTGKTIQVLPVMKFQTEAECGRKCELIEKPFRAEIELPLLDEEGRYLLHVRSLNGQSVNEVFYRTPHNP